jgi:hypothetical protein
MFAPKIGLLVATATGALLLPLGVAQDAPPGGLERVDPAEDSAVPREGKIAARVDLERVITLLTTEDLDQREENFDRLVRMALSERKILGLLTDLADSRVDLELAWTARLALREVKQTSGPGGRGGRLFSGGVPLDTQGFSPFPLPGMGDLESWGLREAVPGMRAWTRGNPGSRRVEIQHDEQGVLLRIIEIRGGEEQAAREYRGESLETILEANPELEGEIDIQFQGSEIPEGLRFQFGVPGARGIDFEKMVESLRRSRDPNVFFRVLVEPDEDALKEFLTPQRFSPVLRTDKLGVRVGGVSPELAGELGLEEGVGLQVHSAVPGMIAHRLQIGPGDILIQLDDTLLRTPDDISDALSRRAAKDPMKLVWINGLGEKQTRTWTPDGVPAAEGERKDRENR